VLGGVGGEGSTEACRDQKRLDAIGPARPVLQGRDLPRALLRRRTTGLGQRTPSRERLRVKRFCNGRAPGVDSAGNDYNMNNDDADPVRRACVAADSTTPRLPARFGQPPRCARAGLAARRASCALSQRDPDASTVDITTSIAARVRNDPYLRTVGYCRARGL